jgi:site-specific DNA-methyltransferase (cytosine-N4-specific)
MNLLGFDFKVVQNHEIGSRHEFSSKKRDISVWNRDYLSGMQEVMRVLKPKGRAIFVIGDSQVAGQLIDGAKLTLNCAKQLGLDAQVLESVPMTGKSRSFRASYQRPNKFEHIVEMRK